MACIPEILDEGFLSIHNWERFSWSFEVSKNFWTVIDNVALSQVCVVPHWRGMNLEISQWCIWCQTRFVRLAEISGLMSLYILNEINKIVHIDICGLYRNGGLMIVPVNRRVSNIIRKQFLNSSRASKLKLRSIRRKISSNIWMSIIIC